MIFNLVWLPARQTGSSTRTKVLLRIMLRDTTVCEDDLVKQALSLNFGSRPNPDLRRLITRAAMGKPRTVSRAEPPRSRQRLFSSHPSSHQTRVLLHRRRQPAPRLARAA